MENEMIQRVAAAVKAALDAEQKRFQYSWPDDFVCPDANPDFDVRIARAAIEAMREPTEAMVRRGVLSGDRYTAEELISGGWVVLDTLPTADTPVATFEGPDEARDLAEEMTAKGVWQDMNDAALA
jgi:hypothetical protein